MEGQPSWKVQGENLAIITGHITEQTLVPLLLGISHPTSLTAPLGFTR